MWCCKYLILYKLYYCPTFILTNMNELTLFYFLNLKYNDNVTIFNALYYSSTSVAKNLWFNEAIFLNILTNYIYDLEYYCRDLEYYCHLQTSRATWFSILDQWKIGNYFELKVCCLSITCIAKNNKLEIFRISILNIFHHLRVQ